MSSIYLLWEKNITRDLCGGSGFKNMVVEFRHFLCKISERLSRFLLCVKRKSGKEHKESFF